MATTSPATLAIAELREFAGFTACEQRYIKRSLDVGLGRQDAFKLWARDAGENASIRSQYVAYQELKALRAALPGEEGFDALDSYMGKLIRLAAFDLAQERLSGFSAFRFLYERLLGARASLAARRLLCRCGPAPDPARTAQASASVDQRSRRHRAGLVNP
jgi:hypothetical protein